MTPSVWRAAHPDKMTPAAALRARMKIRTPFPASMCTP
jgi:hypothetical protein